MGIRGLSTFVKRRQDKFLTKHKLCNEVIIIDGDNLMYYLNSNSKGLNHAFGGDYQKYESKVEAFFSDLIKCGITPIILLDGGSDPSNRKLNTTFSRLTAKLDNTRQLEPSTQHKHVFLPLLSKITFLEVLRRLQLPHAVCPFEADEPLAALARRLGCAVLSNDTDFFAFGVDCVLISSLAAAPEPAADGRLGLGCVLFRHDRFMEQYGLQPQLMPLLGCLLGNDYISPAVLRAFLRHLPRPYGERRGRPAELRIRGLLAWLRRHTDPYQALDEVLSQIGKADRPAVRRLVLRSMASYSHQGSADLVGWLRVPEEVVRRAQLRGHQVLTSFGQCGDRAAASDGETGGRGRRFSGRSNSESSSSDGGPDDGSSDGGSDGDGSEGELDVAPDGEPDAAPADGSDDASAGGPDGPSDDVPDDGAAEGRDDGSGGRPSQCPADGSAGLPPLDGHPVPDWLVDGVRRGLFTSDVINIISSQPLLQEPQVEDPRQPPACVCVEPLLSWIACCLRGDSHTVTAYRRADSGRSVVRRPLAPPAAGAPRPPPLRQIAELTPAQRRGAVLAALGQSEASLAPLPERRHLLAAALGFWRRQTAAPVTAAHVGALLLAERRDQPGVARLAGPNPALLSGQVAADRRLLHQLAQLQCVLAQATNVNALLGSPLAAVSPARLLAGPLWYNAVCRLRQGGLQCSADWLPELLLAQWRAETAALCCALEVSTELPPARAAPAPARRRGPAPRKTPAESKRVMVAESGAEEGARPKATRKARAQPQLIDNRFAALLLDSDDVMSDSG